MWCMIVFYLFVICLFVVMVLVVVVVVYVEFVVVFGFSLFVVCIIGGLGINYVNVEVELWFVVNLVNLNNMIGVW